MDHTDRLAELHKVAQGQPNSEMSRDILALLDLRSTGPLAAQRLLMDARDRLEAGDPKGASIRSWACLSDFPDAAPAARDLLYQADQQLPGLLFGEYLVWVTTRALAAGGSWLKIGTESHSLPTAFDSTVLRFFFELLRERRATAFMDIGANSGSFALLPVADPTLSCHAVEPNPAVAGLLRRHVELNCLDQAVTLHQCALTDRTGHAFLQWSDQTGLATLGTSDHFGGPTECCEVRTLRLDDLVEEQGIRRLDAIKIDTEGHEFPILQGASRVIAEWRPVLLVEAVNTMMLRHGYTRSDLLRFFADNDYRVRSVGTEDLVAVPA